jgi:methylglutaconyl-CoA hydratase
MSAEYRTLKLSSDPRGVSTLVLNRPDVHNAFDETMIRELHAALRSLERDDGTRVVLIRAEGRSFSAGADLNWMKRAARYDEKQNFDDAMALASMLSALDQLQKPTVALVQGPAYGGGVGLLSCCDIVAAVERAVFALSEVKLGLVPAVISPYVVRAIGARAARRYFQSAERFDASEALRIGLVHEIVTGDACVAPIIDALLSGGPNAQRISKQLIARVENRPVTGDLLEHTARTIAGVRVSDEGQEGLNAFLEKRRSRWRGRDDR